MPLFAQVVQSFVQMSAADACFEAALALAKDHGLIASNFAASSASPLDATVTAEAAVVCAWLQRGQLRLLEGLFEPAVADLNLARRKSESLHHRCKEALTKSFEPPPPGPSPPPPSPSPPSPSPPWPW